MNESEAVHSGYPHWWDAFYAVIAAVVAVAITVADGPPARRVVALAALAGMTVLHVAAGRRLIRRPGDSVAAVVVLFVQIVIFAVAIAAMPVATWLMFAVTPMIFQMAPTGLAVGAVLLVNTVPLAIDLATDSGDLRADLVIAAVSASSGIWLGLWIIRVLEQSTERANLIAQLEASRAEVARLSHEAGVTAERTRLAGEIHDTLAQGFTSIITLIQAADPELRDERLALAVRTAKENLAESRAIVAALAPSALDSGLLDSVRRQASRFTEETGVPAGFRSTGEPRDLPTATEVVLLRATQEALTNVRRHAGANEVAVLLAYAPESVRVVVRDDGCGFDAAVTGGFGLPGMRKRAEQVGGTLTVHSDPDTGTTIELEVPA
ncbi:sensor histidine kinase [Actinoplanes regularis]|uniref:Signal transduction histidine kinase n=1 Tax=Actinoplanes regularis TaxID=52697 RepID=A0A238URW4_9ACTN|nr:sensor histidine kinase [Actinoplanes regularis]GIE84508.1 two-component sensor histidine kinase [Actinoplanes regularis]SNR24664.1 Signal transduction histidine kinase [Actinoplanes regularis]